MGIIEGTIFCIPLITGDFESFGNYFPGPFSALLTRFTPLFPKITPPFDSFGSRFSTISAPLSTDPGCSRTVLYCTHRPRCKVLRYTVIYTSICCIHATHSILVLTRHHFECILVCMKQTLILVVALCLSACGTVPAQHSDRQLFEQIPNWDNAAIKICGKLSDRC